MKSEHVDRCWNQIDLCTSVHLNNILEEWPDRCDQLMFLTKGVLKEARTWSTDVWPHCASACLQVCTYVYLYTRARGCVSRFQLKWRFMVFKLAHASRRGLLSDPRIGCCLCVFFIWINWSPVWKILLTNGAGRSWTAAYLLQFVRSIFSQPQPRDDFTQEKRKRK